MIKEQETPVPFFITFVAPKTGNMPGQPTLKFLSQLQRNNNRAWFEAHRGCFEEVKSDFHSFVEKLIPEITRFDLSIGSQTAKQCIFRINRDVRFSKDK